MASWQVATLHFFLSSLSVLVKANDLRGYPFVNWLNLWPIYTIVLYAVCLINGLTGCGDQFVAG